MNNAFSRSEPFNCGFAEAIMGVATVAQRPDELARKLKTLKWMKSIKRWSKSSGTDFAVISNTHCVVLSNVHFEKETASTTRV